MSSSLRLFPALPSNLRTYVSATTDLCDTTTVTKFTISSGIWTISDVSAADVSNDIYEDLGRVVFHDPDVYASATLSNRTPRVDVRKLRELSSDGKITVGSEFYASLGTRVKDTTGKTAAAIEPCWFGLNASGTVGRL